MNISDKITFLNQNNIEVMKTIPDNYFDLVIDDPPYGLNAPNMSMGTSKKRSLKGDGVSVAKRLKGKLNTGAGKFKNRILNKNGFDWDNEIPSEEYFKELFRISKNQIIFGGNYFPFLWKQPIRGVGYWNKKQPWENFSQFELIWTSFDCPAFEIKISSRGGNNLEEKIHPTQKPISLYKNLLKKFAKSNDKILDPHTGSGSSILACYDFGLNITAIEINEIYYNDSTKRVKNYIKTHESLFDRNSLIILNNSL